MTADTDAVAETTGLSRADYPELLATSATDDHSLESLASVVTRTEAAADLAAQPSHWVCLARRLLSCRTATRSPVE